MVTHEDICQRSKRKLVQHGAAPRIHHQDLRADKPKTKIAGLDEKTDALDEDTAHDCKRPRRADLAALQAAQSVIG